MIPFRKSSSVFVAGDQGFVGGAIRAELARLGFERVFPRDGVGPDLTSFPAVESFFLKHRPEYVFLVGGRSGGIGANQRYPADLMIENLKVQCNVIECSRARGVRKLLFLASSCTYPRDCRQPMRPSHIMTGVLEPTNVAYATAKIAGIVMCGACRQQFGADFTAAIPATPFGPGDCFDIRDSHVVSALVRRMQEAKDAGQPVVKIWGTGKPVRDFIFSADLARACIHLMRKYDGDAPVNIGTGRGVSIATLARTIAREVGYRGRIEFDRSKPDGMPRKTLDVSVLRKLGWRPAWSLREGLAETISWFREERHRADRRADR